MGLRNFLYIFVVAMSFSAPAAAQEPVLGGEAEAEAAAPTEVWGGRCVSEARQSSAECTMTIRAVVRNTQRVIGTATLRLPADGAAPSLHVSLPLGVVYLEAGIGFNVDGAATQQLELQTCDRNACYATGPVSPETLAAMQNGQQLNIVFQTTSKQAVTLELSLVGFTAIYQKLK
ncbi:invasion associated locus B family protein [Devosia sp. Root105]|uniref:invasion associated locus B family protein n=1 Tax=Devosia sp. Root105 TaxID=1736423 RepID=UPI0006FE3070|nr:invasion associated locus B family protein [Devosia sp. Root105]KQU99256.1 hypothetical protein ASC68_07720 [Devosia sp. Root105]